MFKYICLISIVAIGCSSHSSQNNLVPSGGNAGDNGEAGESGLGGDGGSAGKNTSGGSSGLSGASGSVNGGSSGESSGGSSGAAGSNVGGNASGGNGGDNNAGTSGSGPCVPKTCDTVSFEAVGEVGRACGTVPDDGCGNVLLCGNCQNVNHTCGGGVPNSNGIEGEGIPNICNGGCTQILPPYNKTCPIDKPNDYMCTSFTQEPPWPYCNPIFDLDPPVNEWCCTI